MSDVDEALLIYQLKSRQINRREFIKRGLMLGLSIGAVQSLLAACAPQPMPTEAPPTAVPPTATSAPAATAAPAPTPPPTGPVRGGTVVIANADAPICRHPNLAKTTGDYGSYQPAYDYLIWLDEGYAYQPMLAESWEPLEEGKIWQFNLRKGVKFHHGTEFTADDVIHTWNLILDPEFGSPVRGAFEKLEGLEKVDDYTVLFHWKGIFIDCPAYTTFYQCWIVPHDKPVDHDYWSESVGTGPFRLKEYVPGEYLEFMRNEDYWGAGEGFPYLDGVKFVYIAEQETQLAALEAGQIDVMAQLKPELIPAAKLIPNVTVSAVETASYQPIKMRCDREPFTDVRVRQAMKWVVDREVMKKATVGDYGSYGNDHTIAPCFPLHTPLPLRQRDPEKAKALLADAGYPDGIDVELYAPNGRPPIVQQALAFQEMAEEGGIRVIIKTEPWHVWVGTDDEIEVTCGITNWSSRTVPGQVLNLHYRCAANWNIQAWCDEEYERLVDESDAELDFDKRKAIYEEIEQLFHDRGPVVISYFKGEQRALRNNVQGFMAHPLVWFNRVKDTWLSEE